METLNAIMESEEMGLFVENNQELITEVTNASNDFAGVIFEYVMNNPDVFIEANVEDMKKNIRTFSEVAMAQYLTEVTAIASQDAKIVEPITSENALNDYI